MFKIFILNLFLIASLSTQAFSMKYVHEGHFVFDAERKYMKVFTDQQITVDHPNQYGYEVYGPHGLEEWLKILGVSYRRLPEFEHDHSNKDFLGYPTPSEVYKRVQKLVDENPDILKSFSIGKSHNDVDILTVKLSDNVEKDEVEPEFKYIANMHGNEIVGRELMVLFLEDIVQRYRDQDAEAVSLINNTEIYIIPTMNPDGSAKKRRGNGRWIDLNRDFPDFTTQDNDNTPEGRQPETQAVMIFQAQRNFALSANFHGGTKVVNYPWDTSEEVAPLNPLIIALSKEYASKVDGMYNSTEFQHGIVNGYRWYEVNGGMQDWSYNWHGDLQVTIELSHQKWPDYSGIPQFYEDNAWSLTRFASRIHQGLGFKFDDKKTKGKVTISTLGSAGKEKIGEYRFAGGEYYKVLPIGFYQVEIKLEDGTEYSFNQSVEFPIKKENGNYIQL
ncbi:MAG: hypothetical protein GY909_03065 [Oligoflexia bacterium]|nr:hypothetical protein [Oligoflexia bacterium]